MRPTRVWDVLAGLVAGLVVAYLLLDAFYTSLPALPRTPAVSLGLVALVEAELGRGTRARLDGRPRTRPITPIAVARFAALARASVLAAAVVIGAWIAVLAYTLPRLGRPAVAGADAITAGLGAASAVALLAAALYLERACRVRR